MRRGFCRFLKSLEYCSGNIRQLRLTFLKLINEGHKLRSRLAISDGRLEFDLPGRFHCRLGQAVAERLYREDVLDSSIISEHEAQSYVAVRLCLARVISVF